MVRLQNLQLTLGSLAGDVHILRGIDLTVDPGESVSIVGPSGSGKSTMMMVMGGLERPSSGQVEVAGTELTRLSEDKLALFRRDNVGIVFQNFHLVPTMTALENVAMPLEFGGHRDAFARAEAQLDAVGLAHRLTHYPAQLSGGEQQRVALARACAPQPKLLLADEPTGNLDGKTGDAVMDLLFGLHDSMNMTLLLITHDPQLAEKCDRVVSIENGRIADDGRAAPEPALRSA